MTKTKRTIHNPITGHCIIFLEAAAQTEGERLQLEYIVERHEDKPRIPLHYHHLATERFEVMRGTLGVMLYGQQREMRAGESVIIVPDALHTFWNAGTDELHFVTDITPAGQFQTYFETVFGLASDGKVSAQGLPNLLQLVVLAEIADSYTPGLPLFVFQRVIALIALAGKLMGSKARYARYSD